MERRQRLANRLGIRAASRYRPVKTRAKKQSHHELGSPAEDRAAAVAIIRSLNPGVIGLRSSRVRLPAAQKIAVATAAYIKGESHDVATIIESSVVPRDLFCAGKSDRGEFALLDKTNGDSFPSGVP